MDWNKLMKIPNINLQFRRFILMSICEGKVNNIFDSTSETGIPTTTRLSLQTTIPFRSAVQQLDPTAASAKDVRRSTTRPLPATNQVHTLDSDTDEDEHHISPAHNREDKPPKSATATDTTTHDNPTAHAQLQRASRTLPELGASTDTDEETPTIRTKPRKRSRAQIELDAPRNINKRKRRQHARKEKAQLPSESTKTRSHRTNRKKRRVTR
eukprot:CAMPEP_0185812878 /NCGR_PEP_ID=MMETSP1322-20130828/10159_1 /TAXON_ID=265543 /ORGANISM="Minutocellus polymorphus, Strain RCC2270" /LENGTH=211 /DNA_ID=CAMNT_0028509469 /DNA_START=297 /DNA_END=929 /DNA_ORIENTATION=-